LAAAHDPKRMKDAKIVKLLSRIEGVGDSSLVDPLRRWRCIMEITLKNGRQVSGQTMAAKGKFENPLMLKEVEAKAHDLMSPLVGNQRSRSLMAALHDIDTNENIRSLRRLYAH